MAPTSPKQGLGKSNLMKQGHTTDGNFGTDPNVKTKGRSGSPRDLGVNATKK